MKSDAFLVVLPDFAGKHLPVPVWMVRVEPEAVFGSKLGYYHFTTEIVSMLNRKLILVGIGFAMTLIVAFMSDATGATTPEQATASSKPAVTNVAQLIRRLRSRGHKVARKERVEQPFLSVKGNIIKIDDQDVQVFEYRTAHAAQLDAKKINRSGSSTTSSMPMWIAPPHFFKTGRLIVLYVGEDQSVLQALVAILGPQFAGK